MGTHENKLGSLYGIDADFLLNNLGGDEDFYRMLLRVFYDEKLNTVDSLRCSLSRCDEKAFCGELHSFLGAAANCGVVKASSMGREVYNSAKAGDMKTAEEKFDNFAMEVSRVLSSLHNWLDV